jgi:predicted aminopeptidase
LEFNEQQDELQQWLHLQKVSNDFSSLVRIARTQLAVLYHSEKTDTAMRQKKAEIFSAFSAGYQKLSDEKWQGKTYYSSWFQEPLNNARLALYDTYEGSHCAFQELWDKSAGDWQKFHKLAEQKSRLTKDERRQWLKQSCSVIAPQTKL